MNKRKVSLYAKLSDMAYLDMDSVKFKSDIADLKVRLIATFKNNDTGIRGMVLQDGDAFGIVLGYGEGYASWLPEFNVNSCELANNLGSKFSVNTKMTSAFSSIKGVIIELLRGRETPTAFEWAGHGAAGAMATLGAFWTSQWPTAPTNLYTYGSPRVGDERFAELINGKLNECYRIVIEGDRIPNVPVVDEEGTPYKHIRGKVTVDLNGKMVKVETTGFYEKIKKGWRAFKNKVGGKNHEMVMLVQQLPKTAEAHGKLLEPLEKALGKDPE